MKDKKSFGKFISDRRKELGLTQAELANELYVTVTAVSKWERGVTYPDITLISDLCAILKVDEHELIAEGTSTEYRKIRQDAKKYRRVANAWFWTFVSAYAVALLVCFICNLAINRKLNWFFIVLTSIITAFTLFPSVTRFVPKYKLLAVSGSFVFALLLLLLTCCLYMGGSWFIISASAIIFAYALIFLPVFVRIYPLPDGVKRHGALICTGIDFALLVILLIACLYYYPYALLRGIITSAYCCAPFVIILSVGQYAKINRYFKGAIACAVFGVMFFALDAFLCKLFGWEYTFSVNFLNWQGETINSNIYLIVLICALSASAILLALGICKHLRKK